MSVSRRATGRSGGRSTNRAPTVLVVDDHPLWRQTVRTLLESSGAASEVLEAGDGAEAVVVAQSRRPDVVIMDVSLPTMQGVDATRQIVESLEGTRVLVLSSSDAENQVVAAVEAGAAGYLLKTAGQSEILEGVRRVHAGELVFPASLAALVLDELRGNRRRHALEGPLAALTGREVEVLALMAQGHTNESIGRAIHVSAKTVEANVTSIFSKLGLDPAAGGHRRVLAVIAYLDAARHHLPTPRGNR